MIEVVNDLFIGLRESDKRTWGRKKESMACVGMGTG